MKGVFMDRIKSLERAVEMEKEGKAFFLRAAGGAGSSLAKNIFDELARQEDFHIRKIVEVYEAMRQNQGFAEWVTTVVDADRLGKVFEDSLIEKVKGSESDIKALEFGLEIEDKSVKYYDGLAALAADNREKRFYLTLSGEERGHYMRIMDSIQYLSDPVGWFYVKQGSMVDGG